MEVEAPLSERQEAQKPSEEEGHTSRPSDKVIDLNSNLQLGNTLHIQLDANSQIEALSETEEAQKTEN